MQISRYIKFPLIFGLLMSIPHLFTISTSTVNQLLISFIYGAIVGIALQIYNDYKTRQIKLNSNENDFAVNHTKQTFLLCDYETAFNLCLESVKFVRKCDVQSSEKARGFIKAKTGMSWKCWGNSVEFTLTEISENTTEVEILVKPVFKTTLIDYGESVEIIKTILNFFDIQNELLTYKFLEAKSEIPIDIYSQNSQSKTKNKN